MFGKDCHVYLSAQALEGFEHYKYNSRDTSPLSNYVMHPFWNHVVRLYPLWVAPNLLTMMGFLCCWFHYLLAAYFDYSFVASNLDPGSSAPIPSWVWFTLAILLFLSHTLDGTDGKQARRTGTSSPLGELFDHGCDAWATVLTASTFYNVFGSDSYGLSPIWMFFAHWCVFICFYVSHWEKYNTGIMYLPWTYDISMAGGSLLYLLTAIVGVRAYKINFPGGFRIGGIMLIVVMAGTFALSIPMALKNIYLSYREGTGKLRPVGEALRPLSSLFMLGVSCWTWALASPNNVLNFDPRCFYYMTDPLDHRKQYRG